MRRVSVTAVLVAGLVSSACGSGDSGSADPALVADAFAAVESNVDYVEGYAELDDCPLGDLGALATAATVIIDLPDGVIEGDQTVDAYGAEPDYPALIQCFTALPADDSLTIDDPQSFGVSVSGLPPGSYREFLLDAAFGEGTTVVVDRSMQRHDGDVFGYCYTGEVVGCAADWVDREHEIAISVYLDGAERTSDECITVLDALLERLMTGLVDYSKTTPWANGKSLE